MCSVRLYEKGNDVDSAAVGARIRVGRQSRGLSLRELASRVGVSASMLSQVENGKSFASVSTLHALVTELDISLDELFRAESDPAMDAEPAVASVADDLPRNGSSSGAAHVPSPASAPPVLHAGARQTLEMAGGVLWERLSSTSHQLADARLVTYPPGSSSSSDGRLMRHNGTEFAYLIEGELTLRLGYDTYTLQAGDSLSFDSTVPHLYTNRGETDARGVWFEVGRHVAGGLAQDWPSRLDGRTSPDAH
jgi:quercetin dioxygenase-like cupin family protein/DNA-binding XRE family transcriptional regulator